MWNSLSLGSSSSSSSSIIVEVVVVVELAVVVVVPAIYRRPAVAYNRVHHTNQTPLKKNPDAYFHRFLILKKFYIESF